MKRSMQLDPHDVVAAVDRTDAMEMIIALDDRMAATDFTLELLRNRIKSLSADMTMDEIASELGFNVAKFEI